MDPIKPFTAKIVALPIADVDTDQIIPARYLKTTDKAGLGDGLFSDWRYNADGSPKPDFVLNRPDVRGAQVLVVTQQFRLRLLARARSLGARGLWLLRR